MNIESRFDEIELQQILLKKTNRNYVCFVVNTNNDCCELNSNIQNERVFK